MAQPLIEINLIGLRDVKGRFARVTEGLMEVRREELRELGREAVAALQDEAPERTGRLRTGIRYRTEEHGNELRLKVTSSAEYTNLVIRGRGPVEAKQAKALRFEPGGPGSGFIFRKRVGPAKANPFVARGIAKLGGAEERTARRVANRIRSMWEAG